MTDNTDWQPIEFEDIRKGDRVQSTHLIRRGDLVESYTRVGVAHSEGDPGWLTHDGWFMAEPHWSHRLDPSSRPPEPEIPVGTAGTATVRGVKGVRVMRGKRSSDDYPYWMSAEEVHGFLHHPISDVTDFIPDEFLTRDALREQIKAEERGRIAFLLESWDDAPYLQRSDRERVVDWLLHGAR